MRDIVVGRELQHLGVDHDQPQLVRRHAEEHGEDHAVEAHGLARSGRARDEQMRHGGEIGDDGLAEDVLAQDDRQVRLGLGEGGAGDELVQHHRFAIGIGQLDADHRAPRHGRDARREGGHVARDVVGELDDAARLDAGRGLQLVHGDDRAGAHFLDRAFHMEVVEHAFEQAGITLQSLLVELAGRRGGRSRKQLGRRQVVIAEQVLLPRNRRERLGDGIGIGLLDADRRALGGLDRAARSGLARHGGHR